MNSLEQEYYCALLLLAEEDEKAAIPKTNIHILVRQHFEMRSVLVEFSTPFQNLMNYFSHPLSLKTWKLSDMHVITGAFTFKYTPAIFRNKLTTFLVFEQSLLARNRQLDEFVYIIC